MGYGLKGGQNNYVIIHKLSFVGVSDYKHGLIKGALFFFFLLLRYNKYIPEGRRCVLRDLIIHQTLRPKVESVCHPGPAGCCCTT